MYNLNDSVSVNANDTEYGDAYAVDYTVELVESDILHYALYKMPSTPEGMRELLTELRQTGKLSQGVV